MLVHSYSSAIQGTDDVDSLHQTMSTPSPHHGQDTAVLLGRMYVFAAFGGPNLVLHFSFWR
jgi:hypothetical protein